VKYRIKQEILGFDYRAGTLRVYLTENIIHNNSVKLSKLQVGNDKEEQQFNLNETADKKKETTLCKTEGLQCQWLSSQCQSAAQLN
jgi:hypothetical protein